MDIEKLRFPIGKFSPGEIQFDDLEIWLKDIQNLPNELSSLCKNLNEKELAFIYRPDGWTIRQLVHHLADSHMNAIIRFKLALSEDKPIIKPYMEGLWAVMDDVKTTPIQASLNILEGIHARLFELVKGMSVQDYSRTYVHPEHGKTWDLAYTLGMYSWHGRHHLEHIKLALKFERSNWN